MAYDCGTERPTLQTLPMETRQAILCELPDVRSLRSAALSCPPLYQAFISAEHILTSKVLLRQLPQDVLPEAVAALHSASISPWPRAETQDFVSKHFFTRKHVQWKWNMKEALAMISLYNHIKFFATGFASEALARTPISTPAPASRRELARIERALYRFQVYCNLFPGLKRPLFDAAFQKALYFNKFSPWENEQLAAVHDYLHRSICPGKLDVQSNNAT